MRTHPPWEKGQSRPQGPLCLTLPCPRGCGASTRGWNCISPAAWAWRPLVLSGPGFFLTLSWTIGYSWSISGVTNWMKETGLIPSRLSAPGDLR